jgi:parallel beta-helix repeat protein
MTTAPPRILFAFLLLLSPAVARADTWYILKDGLGDAPTIQAGIDSATTGDTVLVAPGEYTESLVMKNGVTLLSEEGPFRTRLVADPGNVPQHAIYGMQLGQHRTEINGFWIAGFTANDQGALYLTTCKRVNVENNVFTGNTVGVYVTNGSAFLYNNTFIGNSLYGYDASNVGSGLLSNNIMWNRAVGFGRVIAFYNDFLDLSDAGPVNTENFSLDPQFCGAGAGNYFLQSDSPCAPGIGPYPDEGLIGALPVNCGSVDTRPATWGFIKSLYSP